MKGRLRQPRSNQEWNVGITSARVGDSGEAPIARIDDRDIEFHHTSVGPGRGWIIRQGAVAPYYTWIDGARVHVWVNGRVYEFEKVDGSARRGGRSAEAAVSDTVKAPMPGTVLKVLAQAGVEFEAHQALIVLESMKMEMSLSVPHAGVVLDILCKEGALVEMGAVLARLGSIAESAT